VKSFPCTLPIDCPSDEEALKDFEELCSYVPRIKKMPWSSRSHGIKKIYDYTLPIDRVGMQSSNRFHYGARMACDSVNSPSVIRSWYIKKFRKGLESSIYYDKSPKTALALRKYISIYCRGSKTVKFEKTTIKAHLHGRLKSAMGYKFIFVDILRSMN
jgi:hypothetical protein